MNVYKSVKQIAEIYGVSHETVRRWARSGRISCKKIGKKWHFAASEIYTQKSEKYAQQLLGITAEHQLHDKSFDFLHDGQRIEVKATGMKQSGIGYYWRFTIESSSATNQKRFKLNNSEYFLFLCYDDKWKNVLRSYLIATPILLDKLTSRHAFNIYAEDESLDKYKLFMKGGE